MSETLPRSTVVVALIFAFGILSLFSIVFIVLCRRTPRTTKECISGDAESSSTAMTDRTKGRPASVYWQEQRLGHELARKQSNSRLQPLFSRRESREIFKSITPTVSRPIIFGDKTCVQVTVTPPTPAKNH